MSSLLTSLRAAEREELRRLLAEDVAFHSPVADYEGRERIVNLLATIGTVIDDMRPTRAVSGGAETITFLEGAVDGRPLDGVLDEVRDEAGRVRDVTLMLRPLDALIPAVKRMGAALESQRRAA